MKRFFAIAIACGLAGCTPAPVAQQTASTAGARSCIPISQIVGRYVVPPNAVQFEVAGPVNYRNNLASACPGLERLGKSAVIELAETTGGQLCGGDRIRVYDPVEARATGSRSYPTCVLGQFAPVAR